MLILTTVTPKASNSVFLNIYFLKNLPFFSLILNIKKQEIQFMNVAE